MINEFVTHKNHYNFYYIIFDIKKAHNIHQKNYFFPDKYDKHAGLWD